MSNDINPVSYPQNNMGLSFTAVTGSANLLGQNNTTVPQTEKSTDGTYTPPAQYGGGIKKDPAPLFFPIEWPEDTASRPQIRFSAIHRQFDPSGAQTGVNREDIYLPCPANIAFGDQASLSTIDLGISGAQLNDRINNRNNTQDVAASDVLTEAIKTAGTKVLSTFSEGQTNNFLFANRTLLNPFQNTAYQGAGIRSFTFNFKMIAESPEEAMRIKAICDRFRAGMYAKTGGFTQDVTDSLVGAALKYPPIWQIDFITRMNNNGVEINKHIPKIFACYLQSFNTTFNTTSGAWHFNGAPLEVDCSITYQESRALTHNDITGMEAGDGQDPDAVYASRGIAPSGRSIATPDIQYKDMKEEAPVVEYSPTNEENINLSDFVPGESIGDLYVSQDVYGTGGNPVADSITVDLSSLTNAADLLNSDNTSISFSNVNLNNPTGQ
tara:strand:- start:1037 stop:2353 length:1317 start_codon:yes stop_codon:yes gene_type:complete